MEDTTLQCLLISKNGDAGERWQRLNLGIGESLGLIESGIAKAQLQNCPANCHELGDLIRTHPVYVPTTQTIGSGVG